MAATSLDEIERQFAELRTEEQLNLLERLVHCVRAGLPDVRRAWETEVTAMAADPDIQRELGLINSECSR